MSDPPDLPGTTWRLQQGNGAETVELDPAAQCARHHRRHTGRRFHRVSRYWWGEWDRGGIAGRLQHHRPPDIDPLKRFKTGWAVPKVIAQMGRLSGGRLEGRQPIQIVQAGAYFASRHHRLR